MVKETRTMFKNRFRTLSRDEKVKVLRDLQATLMREYNVVRKGGQSQGSLREIRRRIAICKTLMNEPGFHYHPRRGVK